MPWLFICLFFLQTWYFNLLSEQLKPIMRIYNIYLKIFRNDNFNYLIVICAATIPALYLKYSLGVSDPIEIFLVWFASFSLIIAFFRAFKDTITEKFLKQYKDPHFMELVIDKEAFCDDDKKYEELLEREKQSLTLKKKKLSNQYK